MLCNTKFTVNGKYDRLPKYTYKKESINPPVKNAKRSVINENHKTVPVM